MSSVPQEIPDELKAAWGRLLAGGDARRLRNHLPAFRQSVAQVRELESSLKDAFGGTTAEAVNPIKRSKARTTIVASLQSHSLSVGGILKEFYHLSAEGQGAAKAVLEWIVGHLVNALTTFAAYLGLQNWSVAAEVSSTPPGASFTFTLTFA